MQSTKLSIRIQTVKHCNPTMVQAATNLLGTRAGDWSKATLHVNLNFHRPPLVNGKSCRLSFSIWSPNKKDSDEQSLDWGHWSDQKKKQIGDIGIKTFCFLFLLFCLSILTLHNKKSIVLGFNWVVLIFSIFCYIRMHRIEKSENGTKIISNTKNQLEHDNGLIERIISRLIELQ